MSDLGMKKVELTGRQLEFFSYIYEFTREHGFQPSMRDVCGHFDLETERSVSSFLFYLGLKGYVEVRPREKRAIRFLKRPDGTPFRGFADLEG